MKRKGWECEMLEWEEMKDVVLGVGVFFSLFLSS